uniref:Uncharacterized protein n=1 Tax=Meloidogyne floridensis TaxID=298350 RepID=A0A915NKL1_9BILA
MYDFHNSAKNFRLVEPAKAWNEFKVKIENNFPVEQTIQKVKFTVEKEKFFTEIVEKIELYWDKLNRKNKETNAGQTLHAFPEILDWLKQKTSNWEGQTSASEALKNIKEKITEIYKLTEDTKKHAQKMLYYTFLLHALFEFFESIFAEAKKQISSGNVSVINQICGKDKDKSYIENCVNSLNDLSDILKECHVKIGLFAKSQKFLGEWEDYSKNIKGKFEVELDAPAPLPEAPKVRKVLKRKVRGHGRFEYLEPEDYEFNEDLRFGPGYHYSPRHMYHRGPHKVKGKYSVKKSPKRVKINHQATYIYGKK